MDKVEKVYVNVDISISCLKTKIDYTMAERMEEYKNEIRKQYRINNNIKNNREYKVAEVIGIVIYTGKGKWDAKQRLEDLKISNKRINQKNSYEVICTNNYSINELEEKIQEQQSILSKINLLEKVCKEKDINKIKEVIENIKLNEREFQIIEAYAKNRIRIKFGKEISLELINILKEKNVKEEEEMFGDFAVNLYENGLKKGKREGRKEAKEAICPKLYDMGIKKGQIAKVLGISVKRVEEILDNA